MDRYKITLLLLVSLSFLLGACPSAKQPTSKVQFYTLEYDPPQMTGVESLNSAIRMERFGVAPTYNTSRIIYREGSYKRNAYFYYKWRANPGDLVSYFLSRDMKQSGLFRAVLPHDSRVPSSHKLEGTVDEFFERDNHENWEAVLSVSIVLMAENEPAISKRILYQKTYRAEEACKQRNPKALAEAMSHAMAEISGEIIQDIYDYLKENPPEDLASK
jgi:cholesterol transport system auxiliary component